jgi:hypothetical protein
MTIYQKYQKFVQEYKSIHEQIPNAEIIAEGLEFKAKDVKKYLDLINQSFISLEDTYSDNMSLHNLIPDESYFEDELFIECEYSELRALLNKLNSKRKTSSCS